MKPHPTPREDRAGTYCEDYETNGCSVHFCPEGCYVRPAAERELERKLEALTSLLEAFADPTTQQFRWSYRCELGAAGYVHFAIDVHPAGLTTESRDRILSMAARLVNRSHT